MSDDAVKKDDSSKTEQHGAVEVSDEEVERLLAGWRSGEAERRVEWTGGPVRLAEFRMSRNHTIAGPEFTQDPTQWAHHPVDSPFLPREVEAVEKETKKVE